MLVESSAPIDESYEDATKLRVGKNAFCQKKIPRWNIDMIIKVRLLQFKALASTSIIHTTDHFTRYYLARCTTYNGVEQDIRKI